MNKRNLHKSIIVLTIIILVIAGGAIYRNAHQTHVEAPQPALAPKVVHIPDTLTDEDIPALEALINKDRAQAGLPPLTRDPRLDAAAKAHCDDMVRLNEWGHYLSDGTSPESFIQAQMPLWHHAGENTTWGWGTPELTNKKLMNSPGHKANILSPVFTNVGYATCAAKSFPNIMVQDLQGL